MPYDDPFVDRLTPFHFLLSVQSPIEKISIIIYSDICSIWWNPSLFVKIAKYSKILTFFYFPSIYQTYILGLMKLLFLMQK